MVRFATFYFLFFASVGVYAPWMPPLLEHHGLSLRAIGLGLGAVSVIRAVMPPLWGMLADRVQVRRQILAVTSATSGLALLGLLVQGGPRLALLWLLAYGFLLAPVLPLIETLTLKGLGAARASYGRVRLWGSLGFIITSIGIGWLVSRTGMPAVPLGAGLPLLAAGIVALRLPARGDATPLLPPGTRGELPWRILLPVLLAAMLGQASHGPYYAFFSIELANNGVSPTLIGVLWAIGVATEVLLMAWSPRLLPRLGLVSAMRWALALAAARWAVVAGTDLLWAVALSQTLHAASYALLHLASVQLVDRVMPAHSKALGQALLSACAYGVGIGGGLALAGALLGPWGYAGLYVAAAGVCGAGLLATSMVRAGSEPKR